MPRKFTLCLLALVVGNIVSLPAMSQGDDCRLNPEDCTILDAHAAAMLQLDSLTVENFTLAGNIELLEPVEFSTTGTGTIQLEDLNRSRVVLQILDTDASNEARLVTQKIIEDRVAALGYADAQVVMVDDEITIEVIDLNQLQEELARILTASGGGTLLEFVDFADVPMSIGDGMCILTDIQVEKGYPTGLCADGSQPIGIDGEVGGLAFHTILTGEALAQVVAIQGNFGSSYISFTLNEEGSKIFADYTAAHLGERLAIVIDGVIISAPNIQQAITTGEAQITGDFTHAEAEELAKRLRGESTLPVELELTSIEIGDAYATVPAEINVEINSLAFSNGGPEFTETDIDELILDADQAQFIFESLALTETNLVREADADLAGETVAIFRSEVPLNTVFEFDGAGGLLGNLLVRAMFPAVNFEEFDLTSGMVQEFFAGNLHDLPDDATMTITRYISLDDFSLVRLSLETDFELLLGVLGRALELELSEGLTDLTTFHLALQADFE